MKALACSLALVAIALGTSACAGGQASTYGSLPRPVRNFVQSTINARPNRGRVREIDVYGPASRAVLVTASSGDWVAESARELRERFYLIVLQGHFVCSECSAPSMVRRKPPQDTIETLVWSPGEGHASDFGLSNGLPTAMSRLHWMGTITLP